MACDWIRNFDIAPEVNLMHMKLRVLNESYILIWRRFTRSFSRKKGNHSA